MVGSAFVSKPKGPDAVLVFESLAVSLGPVSVLVGVEESRPGLVSVPIEPGAVLVFGGLALEAVVTVAAVVGDEAVNPMLLAFGAVLVFEGLVAVSVGTVSAPLDEVAGTVTSVPSAVLVVP